jgi:two-component system response regulator
MTTGNIEILLVEDNLDDVELAVRALRREKLANEITVARDGEEALDVIFCRGAHAARTFQNPPRVVLLDLKLPKVQGLEVLKAIKSDARTKAIPVVIMTSSREERDLVDSYKLGVNAYVQKPVDFEQFRNMVKELGLFWVVINQAPPPRAFEPNGQDR